MTRLQRLRELLGKGTHGTWEAYSAPCCPDMGGVASGTRRPVHACVGNYGHPMTIEDAALIAESHNALAARTVKLETGE